jgi:hypothetical protein
MADRGWPDHAAAVVIPSSVEARVADLEPDEELDKENLLATSRGHRCTHLTQP